MTVVFKPEKLRLDSDKVQGTIKKLSRDFYDRPTIQVANDILGCLLVHQANGITKIGRIVEVEAYLGPKDLAAHTSRGRTARTKAMFGPPGHAYVYLIYGMYHCMNAVTGPEGSGTAVLLRALAPLDGVDSGTNGPGRLCRAMDVNMTHYGIDLCANELWLGQDEQSIKPKNVARSPRIGVDYAGEWVDKPLRFYLDGHPAVSRRPKKSTSKIKQKS